MDYIVQHHLVRQESLQAFLGACYRGRLPSYAAAKGQVRAEINHGRWLVNCPNLCGGALIVTTEEPYFFCVNCGSPENDRQWYTVLFPTQIKAIEAMLLKRPHKSGPADAPNRNWRFGETVADLNKENVVRGIA